MKDSKYKWILYLIVVVIVSTIGIQAYWNYKNYLTNKQQLINDVQVSLDNAVDTYYANLAEKSTIGFAFEGKDQDAFFEEDGKFSTLIKKMDSKDGFQNIDSIDMNTIEGIAFYKGIKVDSILNDFHLTHKKETKLNNNSKRDSIDNFTLLTSKVVISITSDTLQLKAIDKLLHNELSRKKLDLTYGISFKNKLDSIQKLNLDAINFYALNTTSKSSFLPKKSELTVHFTNTTKTILKRILSGLLISTLLVLAVISSLFYLLKIIKHQKQLAEVKNDLISNITHEFKTPIATISVALESIKNFNAIDDKEKTEKYLDMSSNQLSKLNIMVEKMLETATLDSENLELDKAEINCVALLQSVVHKHQMQIENKTIHFNPSEENILATVDEFHFENAINNVIDNAVKYGGNDIYVSISQNAFDFTVLISDDGNMLTKANKDNIFEKFYRVPKGNTHDIKGFGIGLYYTKKIVEKHGGTIQLNLNNDLTTFKLSIPNG